MYAIQVPSWRSGRARRLIGATSALANLTGDGAVRLVVADGLASLNGYERAGSALGVIFDTIGQASLATLRPGPNGQLVVDQAPLPPPQNGNVGLIPLAAAAATAAKKAAPSSPSASDALSYDALGGFVRWLTPGPAGAWTLAASDVRPGGYTHETLLTGDLPTTPRAIVWHPHAAQLFVLDEEFDTAGKPVRIRLLAIGVDGRSRMLWSLAHAPKMSAKPIAQAFLTVSTRDELVLAVDAEDSKGAAASEILVMNTAGRPVQSLALKKINLAAAVYASDSTFIVGRRVAPTSEGLDLESLVIPRADATPKGCGTAWLRNAESTKPWDKCDE